MTVNWTPFLTLFPLRLPANDILTRRGLSVVLVTIGRPKRLNAIQAPTEYIST